MPRGLRENGTIQGTPSMKECEAQTPAPPLVFACPGCGNQLRANAEMAGHRVKCPRCGNVAPVPCPEPEVEPVVEVEALDEELPPQWITLRGVLAVLAAMGMIATIAACAIYANLSFAVTNPADFKYFPPFKPHSNGNNNDHLGAEYCNIAKSMVAGEGFSSPFKEKTGPTAWMPPILPTYLAALLWLSDGDQDAVMTVVICTQVFTLMATGLLVLTLAWQTTNRLGTVVAAAFFLGAVIGDFRLWFQQTHDCWIVLLAMDVVIAGFCWGAPLDGKTRAAAWGLCGGLCALVSPIVGMVWAILSLAAMAQQRAWMRLAIAVVVAGLTLTPWMVRNYLIFGRLIPVKSNVSYELWQSQCLTPDGLLQLRTFAGHPFSSAGSQRQEYKALGEMEFLDRKRELFWKSVEEDPLDFVDRIACRLLGATLWYMPADRVEETRRPFVYWTSRVLHPLPCVAMLFLLATAFWQRPRPAQWIGMGAYVLYLMPYIAVSYYERYAMPLLAVKVLLVIWAADGFLSFLWPPRPAVITGFAK